jgi:hypothetical protein
MTRHQTALPAAIVAALLAVIIVATEVLVPSALAQSAPQEIVVAQNNSGPGNFFRRLFRRQGPQPQREFQRPVFPGFEAPERFVRPRRERRPRQTAPAEPEVAAVEKAPDAKRALVVGDFMAAALAKGLGETYRENANVVVIDASSGASGLVRNDYYDWPARLPEIVAEQKPDAILVMVGGNDRQGIATPTGDQPFGTEGWRTAYASRVAALADALKATGKPVLWGGLVPVEPSAMSRDYSAFNGIVREQLEAKGLKFVDMWNGFADEEGKYVAVGPDIRGQSVQLRSDDGLNFTRAGQRKLAYFVEQDLTDIFGGNAPQLATTDAGVPSTSMDAATAALIGPMVSIDALDLQGGDDLSQRITRGAQRGEVATQVSARLAEDDSELPPAGRADSFVWPLPPPPKVVEPPTLPVARGPR